MSSHAQIERARLSLCGGGGGMRPNAATSRSFAFAFASTTLSIPGYSGPQEQRRNNETHS